MIHNVLADETHPRGCCMSLGANNISTAAWTNTTLISYSVSPTDSIMSAARAQAPQAAQLCDVIAPIIRYPATATTETILSYSIAIRSPSSETINTARRRVLLKLQLFVMSVYGGNIAAAIP